MPQREGSILGKNIAVHCKVMGHSTVSSAKMAESIDMTFWMNVCGPKEPCIRWECRSRWEEVVFGGCPGHSKALAILAAAIAAVFAAEGIIQSPIASCSSRDHSVCQASTNRSLENYEYRQREGCDGSAWRGRSLTSTIVLFIV